jgi:M6 family metalloprotease-like protein
MRERFRHVFSRHDEAQGELVGRFDHPGRNARFKKAQPDTVSPVSLILTLQRTKIMSCKTSLIVAALTLFVTTAVHDANSGNRRSSPEDRGAALRATNVPLQGRLEMAWGDPSPGTKGASRFTVSLVDDTGRRYALDPKHAQKAAGGLEGLMDRRVAVTLMPQSTAVAKASMASGLLVPEVIVPIDDLVSNPLNSNRFQGNARAVSAKVSGTQVWATLMCKFKDIATEQQPKQYFVDMYANTNGMLDHYWRRVSYGNINLTGSTAYGWFRLPQNRSFYIKSDGSLDKDTLYNHCTAAADSTVNFSGVQGINMMFNGVLDGSNWGGTRTTSLDGVNMIRGTTWLESVGWNHVSVVAHEMGHTFGLAHLNNSDGDTDTYDNPWDMMSDSSSNVHTSSTHGDIPEHLSMYSRNALGWVAAGRVQVVTDRKTTTSTTIGLDVAGLLNSTKIQMVKLPVPGSTTRYYIVELRSRGFDTYESKLAYQTVGGAAVPSVIVHSVDTRSDGSVRAWVEDLANPKADVSNGNGSMFITGESWTSSEAATKRWKVMVGAYTASGVNITVSAL